MAFDLCMQARPLVERFHVLCVSCLVLDALFCLIFTYTALASDSDSSDSCNGDGSSSTWSNVVATSVSISALASLWGCFVHGAVACSTPSAPVTAAKVQSVSRYGHVLVAWTFVAAVLEAIAYREQPQCGDSSSSDSSNVDLGTTQGQSDFLWQVAYTLLWLAWICSAVASAVLGRRATPVVASAEAAAAATLPTDAELGTQMTCPAPAPMPQLVGVPVQQFQGSASMCGSMDPGDGAANTTLVSGVPLSGIPLGAPQAVGSPASGIVAQGTPVGDAVGPSPSPSKV